MDFFTHPTFKDFIALAAVMVPINMFITASIWSVANKIGLIHSSVAFNRYDLRTWRLGYALTYSTVFAVLFSALNMVGGGNEAGDLGFAFAAVIAVHVTPFLISLRRAGRRELFTGE